MGLRIKRRAAAGAQGGIALIYAVFGTFVVASMVSVMFTMAGVSDRQADMKRGRSKARLLAEGALDSVEKDLRTALANWDDPVGSGSKVVAGETVTFEVEPLGDQSELVDASGIRKIVQPYEVSTRARVDGIVASANTIVNVEWTPLFQFAVFYDSDLEVHAGPDMTLRGRVHSNRDMYLGGGSTITLDTNYVHAAGNMYRRKKDGNAAGGNVDIRRWVANPFDASEPRDLVRMLSQGQFSPDSISGYDSDFRTGYDSNGDGDFFDSGDWLPFEFGASELWSEASGYTGGTGQTVMTGQHGVTEAVTPDIGSVQAYEAADAGEGDYSFDEFTGEYTYEGPGLGDYAKGHYHENAGLTILVAADGRSYVAYDAQGNDVTASIRSAVSLESITDTRQSGGSGDQTGVLQVDMALLAATSYFPDNGLLYAAHLGMSEGTNAKGVMLTNGSELPASLTVASESPMYVHGDYNSVDKKSAAVIGDAVNLLSNAWDGTKTNSSLPSAADTTYNFAMITGSYNTEPGRYNGGLENLPRFHENWTGVACNISGSFVNIFDSAHATGDWAYGGNRYTAPIRNWEYDELFNTVGGLPPFTPMAVSAGNVVSW